MGKFGKLINDLELDSIYKYFMGRNNGVKVYAPKNLEEIKCLESKTGIDFFSELCDSMLSDSDLLNIKQARDYHLETLGSNKNILSLENLSNAYTFEISAKEFISVHLLVIHTDYFEYCSEGYEVADEVL